MFSFRRKPKKEPDSPRIRTSPSLPELNSQGIPWPEDLVDLNAIRQEPLPEAVPSQGAVKSSFQGPNPDVPILFHKPFRPSIGKRNDGLISSLYMTTPTTPTDAKAIPRSMGKYSQRRARIPPTFNIMVSYDLSASHAQLLYNDIGCRWEGHRKDFTVTFATRNCGYISWRNRRPKACSGAFFEGIPKVNTRNSDCMC